MKDLPSEWIIFDEMLAVEGGKDGHLLIKGCTLLSPACVALLAGQALLRPDILNLRKFLIMSFCHFFSWKGIFTLLGTF